MGELRIVADDGKVLTAIDEGPHDAPVLLVVHGGGGNADGYDEMAADLARDARVVRLRRRRYVETADLPAAYDMHHEAADVLAVARVFDNPVRLFGHSSGAVAALEAALAGPAAFDRVIVYEPPLPTSDLVAGAAGIRAHAALEAGNAVEAMRIHLCDVAQLAPAIVDAILADEHARDTMVAFAAAQLADNDALDALGVGIERFAAMHIPVVLLVGADSPAHLVRRSTELAGVLPAARVVTMPGQGHAAHVLAPHVLAGHVRAANL